MRRIEAVTGREAEAFIGKHIFILEAVGKQLKSSPNEIQSRISTLVDELEGKRKICLRLEQELSRMTAESLINQAKIVSGVTVLTAKVPSSGFPALRQLCDAIRGQLEEAVIVLGTVYDGKPGFMAMVTPDLLSKGLHAGEIVKQVAGVTGGGGGGKAEMAQAGGKDKDKLDEALKLAKKLVQKVS